MLLRAVLFDLGDTLWHFPRMPAPDEIVREVGRRIHAMLDAWGVPMRIGDALAASILDADRDATRHAMLSHGISPCFSELLGDCAERLGLRLDQAQIGELWDGLHVGGPFLGRQLFPGTIELLRHLRDRGYRVATVTNRSLGGARFRAELEVLGILGLFDAVAVSCDDGWLKPHPRLFEKALSDLGVASTDAMMVGDDLHADVFGAKRLGMIAVWKRPPGREQVPTRMPDGSPAEPHYTIDHPSELLELPPFR